MSQGNHPQPVQPSPEQQKILDLRKAMKESFKERGALVDGMIAALIARKMLFILGPPGTAKSAICEALCRAIDGNYFAWLIGKFSTPEELFGSYSVAGIQSDKFVRVTKDKLPEADIAFLDEIFKGSSAILNTLLPVINERVFYNDGRKTVPLQSLFGASNELPQGEELAPLYDRFILRYTVERMKSENSFRDLLTNGLSMEMPKVTKEELAKVQDHISKMKISPTATEKFLEVRRTVQQEGIYVSDRRWMESIGVVKAQAFLNRNAEVETEDLTILENILWATPDQIPTVRTMIRKMCNPIADQLQKHSDAVNQAYTDWKDNQAAKDKDGNSTKPKTNALELFKKVQAAKGALEKLAQHHPNRQDVKDIMEDLTGKMKEIAKAEMGLDI